jgi:hypothetical protein
VPVKVSLPDGLSFEKGTNGMALTESVREVKVKGN